MIILGGMNAMVGVGTNSLYSAGSGLTNSGHTSLPSRVHSPTSTLLGKRTELTSSFRLLYLLYTFLLKFTP